MTLDPAVVTAAIAAFSALAALVGFIVRGFINGSILSRHAVPREDYDRVLAINEGYAAKFGEQTQAVQSLSRTVERLGRLVAALKRG